MSLDSTIESEARRVERKYRMSSAFLLSSCFIRETNLNGSGIGVEKNAEIWDQDPCPSRVANSNISRGSVRQ